MNSNLIARLAGPLAAICITYGLDIPGHAHAPAMLGIATWMAIWWISECVPIAFTAMIPLFAFPLSGIVEARTIAYSANIGGMGTPVGTAPNLVFLETVSATAPGMAPSFLQWMMLGIPMVIVGLGVLFLFMRPRLTGITWEKSDTAILHRDREALGPMRREEKIVGWILGLTALAWMSRNGWADSWDS